MSYFLLKHFVRRKPYGVADMPCLQVLVNLRLGKSSVCSKQQPHRQLQVALDDGIDGLLPAIGAVDVAWSENRPFAISKLVEAEQGVIAYASKVAVVGCFLLLAMHRTLRTVDVRVEVDLSQEGDTVDFTIVVVDGSGYQTDTAYRDRFEPNLLTFKAGQTANLTLAPENTKSALKHSFTSPGLGINESIKYGQPTSFTYTFDTPGTYQYLCTVKNQMVGTITVVQ